MEHVVCTALLVIESTKSAAESVARALLLRNIPSEIRHRANTVIEFGSTLGAVPFEVYVREEDLDRAKGVVAHLQLSGSADPIGVLRWI